VFNSCSALTSIIIPDSVTAIGDYAFSNCSALTSVVIGNGVTTIEGRAFLDCSSLTSIVIPDNVTSIEGFAFSYCESLTNVVIKGKPTVSSDVFKDTPELEKIYVIEGKGYSTTSKIDGKPIEILPAEPTVVTKKMFVESMKIL
jgi:hypothetical protein